MRTADRPYSSVKRPEDKWAHQDKAVECFLKNKHGILAMATGTGKTITAIKIMNRLFNEEKIRRVVITMYGNDLLDQWATQMRKEFLTKQINYHYGSLKMMNNFIMHPDNSLLLVSRDSGNLTRLLKLLDRAPGNYAKDTLFIFDEVHGAGSSTLVENLSGRISPYQYRLGLSATPEREYDDEGNDFLLNEIGPVIFEFTLQDAIKKGILCEFNYLPLPYRLSEEEKQKKKRIIGAFNAKKEAGEPCDEKDLYTRLSFINKTAVDKIRQFDRFIASRKLRNAEKYLGSDQQAVLNAIKSSLMSSEFDTRLSDAFANLAKLREKGNRLDTLLNINQEKLIKAGGEEAELLQARIKELVELISVSKEQLRTIESKDDSDEQLTTDNNLHKAEQEYQYYEQQIAKATRTNAALRKKIIVEELVRAIRNRATSDLKAEIVRKTNEKLKRVITDDFIEIESIDRYIKLDKRDGASEGQTLSIAYCFLGTLFEDSELEFPFVIDSPTGKMDFAKRQAVADIIPHVFNQMVAFVQSAEVERFADRFYANKDSQYITIIASPTGDSVEVHKGIEFFDSYQREHKGDEQ